MFERIRNQSRMRKGGVVASAALLAGTGVFFASGAFADPTPKAKCSEDGDKYFRARAHVEPSVGNHEMVTGYSYKLWGDMQQENNVEFSLVNDYGVPLNGTGVSKDPVTKTGDDDWRWVDLRPNRPLNTANNYAVYGKAIFDVRGPDPRCSDISAYF